MRCERKVRDRPSRAGQSKYLDIYSKDNRQSFNKERVNNLIRVLQSSPRLLYGEGPGVRQ